jgi:hypothetical protein
MTQVERVRERSEDAPAADGMITGPPAAEFFTQPATGKIVQKERP